MNVLHRWDLRPDEAAKVQAELCQRIRLEWDGRDVNLIAGVDMSLTDDKAHAAIIVLRYPDLVPVEGVTADAPLVFPYVPGLLSFREGPAILAAHAKLHRQPDLYMFDGQGIAHPRGMGIASQMGLWLERPTIGVAKSKLFGKFDEPGSNAGDRSDMVDPRTKQVIGLALRTRERANPIFISPGHLIDVPHAVQFVQACLRGYRLPEPTRWAHKFAAGQVLPGLPSEDSGDQLSLFG